MPEAKEVKQEVAGSTEERMQDLEDVVGDMKGELLELMHVYEDVQDKLFDIDRFLFIMWPKNQFTYPQELAEHPGLQWPQTGCQLQL